MKPVIYVVAFTAVINIFWTKGNPAFEFSLSCLSRRAQIRRAYDNSYNRPAFRYRVVLTYATSPVR